MSRLVVYFLLILGPSLVGCGSGDTNKQVTAPPPTKAETPESDPAQMEERRLGLAHLRSNGAVADRLLGLLSKRLDLGGQLVDHVLEA